MNHPSFFAEAAVDRGPAGPLCATMAYHATPSPRPATPTVPGPQVSTQPRVAAPQAHTEQGPSPAGIATRCIAPGCRRICRISPTGIGFILDKLAETVVPVQARTAPATGNRLRQARVCRTEGQTQSWYLSGPTIDFDLAGIAAGWLICHPSVRAGCASLELLDHDQRAIAALQGRANCAAWAALLDWLVFKESSRKHTRRAGQ